MDEKERAERFNRELDAHLEGGAPGPSLPGAARRLGAADFSKASGIKEGLRRRLLERQAAGSRLDALLGGWLPSGPFRLAAAAALLVLVAVFPLRQLVRRAPQADVTPGPVVGAPAVPGTIEPIPAPREPSSGPERGPAPRAREADCLEDSELWRKPVTAEDLIEKSPAKGLFGTVPAQPVFTTIKGRKVARQDRVQIVWETGDSVFILERRATSIDEIFERRAL